MHVVKKYKCRENSSTLEVNAGNFCNDMNFLVRIYELHIRQLYGRTNQTNVAQKRYLHLHRKCFDVIINIKFPCCHFCHNLGVSSFNFLVIDMGCFCWYIGLSAFFSLSSLKSCYRHHTALSYTHSHITTKRNKIRIKRRFVNNT